MGDVIGDLNCAPRASAGDGAERHDDRDQGRGADGRDAHLRARSPLDHAAARATTRWSSCATRRFPAHLVGKVLEAAAAGGCGPGRVGLACRAAGRTGVVRLTALAATIFRDRLGVVATRGVEVALGARGVRHLSARACCGGSIRSASMTGQTVHIVCDLCTARAHRQGWLREGTHLRGGRRPAAPRRARALAGVRACGTRRASEGCGRAREHAGGRVVDDLPASRPSRAEWTADAADRARAGGMFNASEHARTRSAAVLQSLGAPNVHARALGARSAGSWRSPSCGSCAGTGSRWDFENGVVRQSGPGIRARGSLAASFRRGERDHRGESGRLALKVEADGMYYCVVPRGLEGELFEQLAAAGYAQGA